MLLLAMHSIALVLCFVLHVMCYTYMLLHVMLFTVPCCYMLYMLCTVMSYLLYMNTQYVLCMFYAICGTCYVCDMQLFADTGQLSPLSQEQVLLATAGHLSPSLIPSTPSSACQGGAARPQARPLRSDRPFCHQAP